MTSDQSLIPQYLREPNFRIYEHAIAEVVRRWPSVAAINIREHETMPRSIVTCSSRMRYAMKSLQTYRWSTSLIDLGKFLQICTENQGVPSISEKPTKHGGLLIVGPKTDVQNWKDPSGEVAPKKVENSEVLDVSAHNDADEFYALCHLAANHALARPIKVSADQEMVDRALTMHDIAIDLLEDGLYLILN